MEALGLQRTWKSTDATKFLQILRSHGKVLVVRHDDPKKDLKLQIYLLTATGRQMLRLGAFQPHVDYLNKLGAYIQGQGFSVTLADFVQVSETSIRCSNERAIEAQPTVQADGAASGEPAA